MMMVMMVLCLSLLPVFLKFSQLSRLLTETVAASSVFPICIDTNPTLTVAESLAFSLYPRENFTATLNIVPRRS